ncbi:MAG: hypothetical protein K2X27_08450 [Candidatus Obscuribacterales bacterium]|nr:hypothetical protein [Candidatus Obscuribacterales bacterium]
MPRVSEKQRAELFRQRVKNYPQWDAARYQRAVGGTFDRLVTNNDDYMQAVTDAAAQNKPVVMMIGRGSDPASRHVIENSLKESRDKNGRDAVYVFVDMDRVDRNSAIGKYAFENMPAKGQEPPFTMVFGMSKGDARSPVRAEAPSSYRMGPVDAAQITEAVSRLKYQMGGRFDSSLPRPQVNPQPGPFDRPTNPKPENPFGGKPEQAPRLDPRVEEAFGKALLQAKQEQDKERSYKSYKQAIDIADSIKNPALQAAARVELGMACVNWGFAETGFKWIMEAGAINPGLYDSSRNQAFKERLSQGGVNSSAQELLLSNGQRDPLWFQKDGDAAKKLDAALKAGLSKPTSPYLDLQPIPARPQPSAVDPNPHLRPSPFKR